MAIRFEKVDKRYGGMYALRRVSLEVATGECVALVGRNGSGKTTLLRLAAGLVRPSAGSVTHRVNSRIGYVGHAVMVYDELTAEENLILFGKLLGVERAEECAAELLGAVGLLERRNSLVRTFSRGMRQRMAIARALIHRPSVLLLDEPATGLDTAGIAWLAKTLEALGRDGCTMLMSLHGQSDLSAVATRAVRLDTGAVVADTNNGYSKTTIFQNDGPPQHP